MLGATSCDAYITAYLLSRSSASLLLVVNMKVRDIFQMITLDMLRSCIMWAIFELSSYVE